MKLIKDYINEKEYFQKLNELTSEVFGFSFEDWINNGYYTGEYIPYSYWEEGKIVSNVSANIMKFTFDNKVREFIQIGTVMTKKEFRNKALATKLMKYVIDEYKDRCDGIYLFGDLKALDFYKKLGFKIINQYRYSLKKEYMKKIDIKPNLILQINQDNIDLKKLFEEYVKIGTSFSSFHQTNRFGLVMFYCQYFEDIYYIENLDLFVIMEINQNKLIIKDVIGKNYVSFEEILSYINIPYSSLELGFTPQEKDMYLFDASLFDGEDDYRLFILGKELEVIEKEKYYFPLLSHA